MLNSKISYVFPVLILFGVGCGGSPKPAATPTALDQSGNATSDIVAEENNSALAAADPSLMSGKTIIDRSIEASGGKTAIEAITSRVSNCTLDMPTIGLKGPLVIKQKAPDLFYQSMKIPGTIESSGGYDGEVAWEITSMTGSRLLEGDEREDTIRASDIHADLHWEKYFSSATTVSTQDLDGKKAYKVVLVKTSGGEVTRYYDAETFLMLKEDRVAKTQMGDVAFTTIASDYRSVDGLTLPFKLNTEMAGTAMVLSCSSFEHNKAISSEVFELPDAIKSLVETAALKKK